MKYIGRIQKDKILCEDEEKIVIFGAGKELGRLLGKLDEMQVKGKIVCICDNSLEKQGKKIDNIKIVSPDYAIKNYSIANYIVYNRFCVEICKQLIAKGIQNIHLIRN